MREKRLREVERKNKIETIWYKARETEKGIRNKCEEVSREIDEEENREMWINRYEERRQSEQKEI